MAELKNYGDFERRKAEQEYEKLEKRYNEMTADLRGIRDGKKYALSSESYKEEKIDDLNTEILENRYKTMMADEEKTIGEINVKYREDTGKQFRHGRVSRYVKRHGDYKKALELMQNIERNPLVSGSIVNLYENYDELFILDKIIDNLDREEKLKELDPQIQEVFDIVNPVISAFRLSVGRIQTSKNSQTDRLTAYTKRKKISFSTELEAYKHSLTSRVLRNNSEAYKKIEADDKAKRSIDDINVVRRYEYKLENLSPKTNVNKWEIKNNLKTVELIDYIDMINEYLRRFSVFATERTYGNYKFEVKKAKEECKKAMQKLAELKQQLTEELAKTDFQKQVDAMEAELKYDEVVRTLANQYVSLENATGTARREIENDIENTLINNKIPKEMWDSLKYRAQGNADQRRQEKEAEISSKFKTMRDKERREVAIAHKELITEAELEDIRREAETAARSQFPEDYQYKSGDVHDLNYGSREEFIEHYVAERAEAITAMRYDNKERENRVEEKAFMEYTDEMTREGLTPEMVELAAEILQRNDQLQESDPTKLSASDVRYAVNFAKKFKNYAGLDDMDLAEAMARDLMGPNAEVSEKEIKDAKIVQFNLNNMYNIRNRINAFSKEETGPKL